MFIEYKIFFPKMNRFIRIQRRSFNYRLIENDQSRKKLKYLKDIAVDDLTKGLTYEAGILS